MREDGYAIKNLILKHLRLGLNSEEQAILNEWLKEKNNRQLFDDLTNEEMLAERLNKLYSYQAETEKYKKGVKDKLVEEGQLFQIKRGTTWQRYVAAASVFFFLATGAFLWFRWNEKKETIKTEEKIIQAKDIPPGKDGAILTLANGEQIVLDSATNGTLAQQGSAQVKKEGSVLAYNDQGSATEKVLYNTLTTPRGRQFQLALPDGSRIWLNAASSVTFPTSFIGKERKIEITGEAYLEVAKDASKPFMVTGSPLASGGPGWTVEVLGTSFNINSYAEESSIKITLIEGSVKVKVASAVPRNDVVIKPGQQAQISSENIRLLENADVKAAIAWKNGLIALNDADIKVIMRQISRWYDVDIEYRGEVSVPGFIGEIPRTLNLSQVLQAIRLNSELDIKLEDGKVIVVQ